MESVQKDTLITQLANPSGIISVGGISLAVGACLLTSRNHKEAMTNISQTKESLEKLQQYVKTMDPKSMIKAQHSINEVKNGLQHMSEQNLALNDRLNEVNKNIYILKESLNYINDKHERFNKVIMKHLGEVDIETKEPDNQITSETVIKNYEHKKLVNIKLPKENKIPTPLPVSNNDKEDTEDVDEIAAMASIRI